MLVKAEAESQPFDYDDVRAEATAYVAQVQRSRDEYEGLDDEEVIELEAYSVVVERFGEDIAEDDVPFACHLLLYIKLSRV